MMLTPITATDKVYSITPSAMSVGLVSSITGFRLSATDTLGVRSETNYGTTAKVFGQNSGSGDFTQPLYETLASGRDVVVTTWARLGTIFLRCDKAKGRAIKISWSGQTSGGEMRIVYANNVPSTTSALVPSDGISTIDLFQTSNFASYVTGWNTASTAGDQYEFSLIGAVLTVKWNGQTVYTTDDIWFCTTGTVVYAPGNSAAAIRDTTITFKPSVKTYTDFDNRVIDFRDWGWKDVKTTGSMSANSNTLTVASSAGLAIGDPIVVEIGGEAGLGLVGTIGVGGTWPATRVANFASLPDPAVHRATYGDPDSYAYVTGENSVYIAYSNAGVATWGEWTNYVQSDIVRNRGLYHTTKLRPRALKANITAISGNTITLDKSSEAATSGAGVYYDNSSIISYVLGRKFTNAATGFQLVSPTEGWGIQLPRGTFCITKDQSIPLADYWTFKGGGRSSTVLYSPKGTEQFALKMSGESNVISDFKVKAWAGINYWCTDAPNGFIDQQKYAVQNTFLYKSNCVIERIELENTWGGPSFNNRFDSVMRHCKAVQNNGGIQQYATWFFGHSYCVDTWIEDCDYESECVNPAFEIFQATRGGFKRIKSKNGYVSSNTSGGGFLMEDMDIDVDFRAKPAENNWVVPGNPVVNINNNIVSTGGALDPNLVGSGGTIRNPRIKVTKNQEGVCGAAVSIQTSNAYVVVEGTHPDKPGKGVITMSDYNPADPGIPVGPGSLGYAPRGAIGVISDGAFTIVRGIRVIGMAQGNEFANINMRDTTSVIQNCVADQITQWNGSAHVSKMGQNGNITNAAYEALP